MFYSALDLIYNACISTLKHSDYRYKEHTLIYQNALQKKVLATIYKIWNPRPCERINSKGRKRGDSYEQVLEFRLHHY